MALFPLTSTIDNANRANENPLGTASNGDGWSTTQLSGGANTLKVVSNTIRQNALTSGTRFDQYDTVTYGADCEAWVTVSTLPGTNTQLIYRATTVGSANWDGYRLIWTISSGVLAIQEITNNVATGTGISVTISASAGDSIGVRVIGNTHEIWYKASGGSWVFQTSGTEATHTGAGKLALGSVTDGVTTPVYDNFGGGTVTTVTTTQTATGKARIQKSASQTATGKARITATTTQTTTGKARITATTQQTTTGKAIIQKSASQTTTGKSRIEVSTLQAVSGKARITATTSQTVSGKADITNTTTQTISGKSRIEITTLKTITGLSRIAQSVTKDLAGLSRITATTPQTITGKSSMLGITTQTITGKASILSTHSKPCPKIIFLLDGRMALKIAGPIYQPL